MSRTLVIALGGNALGHTPEAQRAAVRATATHIADLSQAGDRIVLTHGNGPQVGIIHLAFDLADAADPQIPAMPFPECTAMSQGYIGWHLQCALQDALRERGIGRDVVTVVTQVVVDATDPAFRHPSKPVGLFYTEAEAMRIAAALGQAFLEDAGRGWRRVVPSPEPRDIVEAEAIRTLVAAGSLVVACGGGGVPVCRDPETGGLTGVDAVIDKDRAAARLAMLVGADRLIILTTVPFAALDYRTPAQRWIPHMKVSEARRFCMEGHFAEGSMLPKVQAGIAFAASRAGRETVIAHLADARKAVGGAAGTRIVAD